MDATFVFEEWLAEIDEAIASMETALTAESDYGFEALIAELSFDPQTAIVAGEPAWKRKRGCW